jgi:hypothetical protein
MDLFLRRGGREWRREVVEGENVEIATRKRTLSNARELIVRAYGATLILCKILAGQSSNLGIQNEI